MPVPLFRWRRYSAWLWICGLFAALCLLWACRRLARGIVGREWRAIEEFGVVVAPLVLFALLWELDGPSDQTSRIEGESAAGRGSRGTEGLRATNPAQAPR
jgi:hypothetical protein